MTGQELALPGVRIPLVGRERGRYALVDQDSLSTVAPYLRRLDNRGDVVTRLRLGRRLVITVRLDSLAGARPLHVNGRRLDCRRANLGAGDSAPRRRRHRLKTTTRSAG